MEQSGSIPQVLIAELAANLVQWHKPTSSRQLEAVLPVFLAGGGKQIPIGVAVSPPTDSRPALVAFCRHSTVLIISADEEYRPLLQRAVQRFEKKGLLFVGFGFHEISSLLKEHFDWSTDGADVHLAFKSKATPGSYIAMHYSKETPIKPIDLLWDLGPQEEYERERDFLCLRAWVTFIVAKARKKSLQSIRDSTLIPEKPPLVESQKPNLAKRGGSGPSRSRDIGRIDKETWGSFQQSVLTNENSKSPPDDVINWHLPSTVDELDEMLDWHFSASHSVTPEPVGMAISIHISRPVATVAFARGQHVLVLQSTDKTIALHERLQEWIKSNGVVVVGFNFGRLAALYKELCLADIRGVDLFALRWVGDKTPTPGCCAKRNYPHIKQFAIDAIWNRTVYDKQTNFGLDALCSRAWITSKIAQDRKAELYSLERADTSILSKTELRLLYDSARELELVAHAKPTKRFAEFTTLEAEGSDVVITNARFKTKLRHDPRAHIVLTHDDGSTTTARTLGAIGRTTKIAARSSNPNIKEIEIHGKEGQTTSESCREAFILSVLQGKSRLKGLPFIDKIWDLDSSGSANSQQAAAKTEISCEAILGLNQSQSSVVLDMTSSEKSLVLVHGPPGTGKTTTISAACEVWREKRKGTWVCAQSNVGVKNIAQSLCKRKVKFLMIVSKEFYHEWHEHLYQEVLDSLIISHEMPVSPREVEILFWGVDIVLCTLGMLSQPLLRLRRIFTYVPMANLVIDEASQISVLELLHLLGEFTDLETLCFFGDPKQLPPYNLDTVPGLKSIYDLEYLDRESFFLDTQYRMPCPLGGFVSSLVYDGRLTSCHPNTDNSLCLSFIDVEGAVESRQGQSWTNQPEIDCLLSLVRNYYLGRQFCIITPYDAQRNAIEAALKRDGLPWENVYNVDSFQGNEAEHIILSVVRTSGPGFLTSVNRVNVMLTRCKQSLVIITSWLFIRKTRETLLGELQNYWMEKFGKKGLWNHRSAILNKTAALFVDPILPEEVEDVEEDMAQLQL